MKGRIYHCLSLFNNSHIDFLCFLFSFFLLGGGLRETRKIGEWASTSGGFFAVGRLLVVVHRLLGYHLLGHHHLNELLVVDLSISINISFANHFINFFI